MTEVVWGVTYHANSRSPRAKRWYRVSRLAHTDDGWFELYWHETLRGNSKADIRALARAQGVPLAPGTFTFKQGSRRGSEMEHHKR